MNGSIDELYELINSIPVTEENQNDIKDIKKALANNDFSYALEKLESLSFGVKKEVENANDEQEENKEEKCRQCLLCVPVCPDSSIPVSEGKRREFDYDHCKGCGICAKVCPFGAIEMKEGK